LENDAKRRKLEAEQLMSIDIDDDDRSIDHIIISLFNFRQHTRYTLAISIAIQLPTYHEALVLQLPLLLLPRVVIIVAQQQQRRQQWPPCVLGLCAVDDTAIASIAAAVTLPIPAPPAAATISTWHGGGQ
jgi:hypothetical protein